MKDEVWPSDPAPGDLTPVDPELREAHVFPDEDPVILDLDRFYELCELTINELREGAFEIGMWRLHNLESLASIVQDALTMHRAMTIVREVIDPREEQDTNDHTTT
jgi:hypothetical protein